MKFGLREFVSMLLVLGLLVGAWFVGFKPLTEQRKRLQADIRSKQETLQRLQAANATVREIEQQLDTLNSTLQKFESKLPHEKDVQQILGDFTRLATANNLVVSSVKPGKAESTPSGNEQPIEVSFKGGYTGFHRFLTQLEGVDRITRIKQMSLKKLDDDDGGMEARVTLSIFYEPDAR